MPLYRDNDSQRFVRIEQLLAEARLKRASLRPADHHQRRELGVRLDTLMDEVLGRFQPRKQRVN